MKSILLKAQFFVILFLLIGETTFAQWQKVNDIDSFPRARPTSFVIGDTAYLGNGDINSGYTTLFAGYTQNSNTWSSVPTYPGGGGDWGFRFVINNRAYVGGGANPAYQNGFYKYAPTTGWTSLGTAPGGILRAFSAGFSIGNKGYVGTGSSSASILLNDFWEYDTLANTWTSEAAFPGAPRTGSVAFAANGYGYIGLGGNSTTGTTYNDMYRYNPGTGKWDTMAPLPTPWGMAAAGYFVLCGKLVVTCGDTVPNVQNTSKKAWLFDPYNGTKGKWTPLPEFPGPLPDYYSPGGFTMGDTGFIYGGFNHLTNNGTAEMYRFIPTPALLDMLVSPVDTTICSGNPITLKGASSVSYIWNTSDTTSNITVSPTTSTIYTVSEISGSCLFIDTVHVNVSPSTSVTITPDSPSMCSGQSVILSVTDTGTNFTWSPSTGLSATTGDSVVANDTATIVYSVIGTSSGGCAFSGTDTVKIIPAPALIIKPQDTTICNGSSVTLFAPSSGSGYNWSPAATLSSPARDSVIASPTIQTTYTVTGIDSVGCTATGTDIIYVNKGFNKPVITDTDNLLITTATQGNQWYKDGAAINGATSESYIATDTGCYYDIATNIANGCSSISNTLCINKLAGIKQLSPNSNQLSIYPNPTSGEINVNINPSVGEVRDWYLQVTDVLGRTVYTRASLNYSNDIDLSNLPGGMYFITVINKTARAVVPVVKQN